MAVAILVGAMVAPAFIWVRFAAAGAVSGPPGLDLLTLAATALLPVLIALTQIFVHIRAFGGTTIRGNREGYPVASGMAARLPRAHANALESLTPFAVIILAVHALGISNQFTVAAALLFFGSRVIHAVTYLAGITVVRSAAFYAGTIAILMSASQLPWGLLV